ncbi:hypothetical protein [Janthinobacterium fluminis]|uniref:Uncharacterized protein n=1 Tax=Janthinobacterium fluminis TaxID=2987524 RepID=A0ABT5K1Q1_9BURK|nr:hypothetical protein [Janthinobacterium fluminis]MDC8758804.1 hypothetical protein [Janthinobacterium fluminis]
MSNEKLKGALKAELIKKMETDATPEENVEVSDGDLDDVAGGRSCGLLLTCGTYSEQPSQKQADE